MYKAQVRVKDDPDVRTYVGQTSRTFKARLANHTNACKYISKRKDTALTDFIWKLKEEGKEYEVAWEKVHEGDTYRRETKRCQLCEKEKMAILEEMKRNEHCLNRRNELLLPCIHKKKEMLAWVEMNDPG